MNLYLLAGPCGGDPAVAAEGRALPRRAWVGSLVAPASRCSPGGKPVLIGERFDGIEGEDWGFSGKGGSVSGGGVDWGGWPFKGLGAAYAGQAAVMPGP